MKKTLANIYETVIQQISEANIKMEQFIGIDGQSIKLVIPGKNEYGEYPVKVYINGKYDEDKTYYTDDKQDAINTLISMKDEFLKKHIEKNTNEEIEDNSNVLSNVKNSYIPLDGIYVIPEGINSIRRFAFWHCISLKSISIPDSVTEIGSNAFYGCKSLKSISIPDSVTYIGDSVFYNCTSLENISIPNSITEIGSHAFYNCINLKSIKIPNSITEIGSYAFYNCTSLKSVTIPSSVTEIGDLVFKNCTSLKEVIIHNPNIKIGEEAFPENTEINIIK